MCNTEQKEQASWVCLMSRGDCLAQSWRGYNELLYRTRLLETASGSPPDGSGPGGRRGASSAFAPFRSLGPNVFFFLHSRLSATSQLFFSPSHSLGKGAMGRGSACWDRGVRVSVAKKRKRERKKKNYFCRVNQADIPPLTFSAASSKETVPQARGCGGGA